MNRRPRLSSVLMLAVSADVAACGTAAVDAGPSPAAETVSATATPTAPTVTPSSPITPRTTPTPTRSRPATTETSVTTAPAPRFPVRVRTGNATQVITVEASGSYATVTAWSKRDGRWRISAGPWPGRVGSNGVVPGSERRQNTGTTPAGTYTMTEAFGIARDPGTEMPYLHVGADDWWVGDNRSSYYNSHRRGSQGGFDTSLPESDVNGSERLLTHSRTYRYAVVIDFNRWPAIRYRGSAIFLHVNGSGATSGCVSIPASAMTTVLRWLTPAAHPRIAIG